MEDASSSHSLTKYLLGPAGAPIATPGRAIIRDFLKSLATVPWNTEGYGKITTDAYFQSRNFERFKPAIVDCAHRAWRGQA